MAYYFRFEEKKIEDKFVKDLYIYIYTDPTAGQYIQRSGGPSRAFSAFGPSGSG